MYSVYPRTPSRIVCKRDATAVVATATVIALVPLDGSMLLFRAMNMCSFVRTQSPVYPACSPPKPYSFPLVLLLQLFIYLYNCMPWVCVCLCVSFMNHYHFVLRCPCRFFLVPFITLFRRRHVEFPMERTNLNLLQHVIFF